MTDPSRPGERFADDPSLDLDDAEQAVLSGTGDTPRDDVSDLDQRSTVDDWTWDDLDRGPVGARTTVLDAPASPLDPEFAPVQPGGAIDTSGERSAEQPVAGDNGVDRISADDLALAPVDFPDEGEGALATERFDQPVAVDARQDLIDDRGGDDRGLPDHAPPAGMERRVERDAAGRTIQRFDLGEVQKVEVEGPATVTISTGGNGLLVVAAVLEDFERIKVMEGRKDVKIEFDGGFMDRKNPVSPISYDFKLTGLTDLKVVKGVSAEIDRLEGGTVTLDIRAGSQVSVGALAVKRLEAKLTDKSHLSAAGTADRQVVDLAGESVYDGAHVQTDRTAVKARDKSRAALSVKTLLRAQATKGSLVDYAGENVDLDIHTEDARIRNVAAH